MCSRVKKLLYHKGRRGSPPARVPGLLWCGDGGILGGGLCRTRPRSSPGRGRRCCWRGRGGRVLAPPTLLPGPRGTPGRALLLLRRRGRSGRTIALPRPRGLPGLRSGVALRGCSGRWHYCRTPLLVLRGRRLVVTRWGAVTGRRRPGRPRPCSSPVGKRGRGRPPTPLAVWRRARGGLLGVVAAAAAPAAATPAPHAAPPAPSAAAPEPIIPPTPTLSSPAAAPGPLILRTLWLCRLYLYQLFMEHVALRKHGLCRGLIVKSNKAKAFAPVCGTINHHYCI
jgi:hypothetical protein